MTRQLLALLREFPGKVTFFVTGQLAERYGDVLREIQGDGHEIACHTFWHKPLCNYTPVEFEDDLKRNLDALLASGVRSVRGFRAPILSMTPQTAWAYPILSRNGITYSSSVLPGANPLYGWPDFGRDAKTVGGLLEIPVSVSRLFGVRLPFASGVYFRVLPFILVKRQVRRFFAQGLPVVAYLHLLDFDPDQEPFALPFAPRNPFYNFLMFYNRAGGMKRLRSLLAREDLRLSTYGEFHTRHFAVDRGSTEL
jgi:polysaccharide deacetylase family protein (PEP-CTERM system associated)